MPNDISPPADIPAADTEADLLEQSAEIKNLPAGEYAIVELLGHSTLVGRIGEAERFGTKMLVIEPLFNDALLPPVYQGGASIYRLTPCSAEVAFASQPRSEWGLPASIRSTIPQFSLPGPPVYAMDDDR